VGEGQTVQSSPIYERCMWHVYVSVFSFFGTLRMVAGFELSNDLLLFLFLWTSFPFVIVLPKIFKL
jgi:hypothetical protein